jgi:PAS domain S-box-containing protein
MAPIERKNEVKYPTSATVPPRFFQRYAIGFGAAFIAISLRMLLAPWLDDNRYAFLLPLAAVVVVGAVAGFGPALLTLIAGGMAASYFLLPPKYDFAIDDPQSVFGLAIFAVVGLICLLIADQAYRNRLAAEVSQRRAVEQTNRLSDMLASITDVFFTLDSNWRFIFVNDPAVQRFGRDVLGQNVWEVFPAAVGNTAHVELQRAMAERVTVAYEVFYPPWERWFADRAFPTADGGLVVYSQDITTSKQQTAALKASEARAQQQLVELEAIYSAAPIGLCVLDRDLRYLRINANLAEINGLPAEAHIGKTMMELVPTLSEQAAAMLRRVLVSGATERIEFRGETPAQPGVERVWDEQWFPLHAPGTQDIIGVCAVIEEITKRKQAEAELRARTQQLESLLTSAPIGVAFFDRAHRYVRINDELAAINGIAAADHVGLTIEALLPEAGGQVAPMLNEVVRTGRAVRHEVSGTTPREPGVLRHWLCGFYPAYLVVNGQVAEVGAWVIEITERKRAEDALHASEQRLQLAMSIAQAGNWDYDFASGQCY